MPSPQSFKFVKNQVHSGNVKCLKNISKVFLLFISNFNTIFVTKVDRIYDAYLILSIFFKLTSMECFFYAIIFS